jgi:hypothetical protein
LGIPVALFYFREHFTEEDNMATNKKKKPEKEVELHENRDPITDERGAHPIGTGVGAAVGGAVGGAALGAAGAAIEGAVAGTVVGGPVGTAVGAAVGIVGGAVGGGLAGKRIAESIDPTVEEAHWRENYRSRPYVEEGAAFEDYGPAYRYGWESRIRHGGRAYEDVEPDLASGWDKARGKSRLGWDKARHATRDAWDRASGHFKCPQESPPPRKG